MEERNKCFPIRCDMITVLYPYICCNFACHQAQRASESRRLDRGESLFEGVDVPLDLVVRRYANLPICSIGCSEKVCQVGSEGGRMKESEHAKTQ
jgi:hypothetical protein